MALDMAVLAGNLKKYRSMKKMTQQELAEKLLVSAQSVSKWECAQSIPELDKLCALAELLDVSVDTLLKPSGVQQKLMVGVDGGGTKTEFVLFQENGQILNRLTFKGSNPNSIGMEQSLQILQSGIDHLMKPGTWPAGIFVGCAGFFSGHYGERIQKALQELYPRSKIGCSSDIMNIIAGSSNSNRCIAVICGTGSVIYANENRNLHRLGGAGYLLDKQGSGFDIGRDVLRAALHDRDGYGEKTLLTAMVEEKLGSTVWDSVHEIYRQGSAFIASFAPLAFEAYGKGDGVAEKFLQENAAYLADMIGAAARIYDCGNTVVLAGSVFASEPAFLQMLRKKLPQNLHIELSAHPPVYGACLMACELCGVDPQPLTKNFGEQYRIYR